MAKQVALATIPTAAIIDRYLSDETTKSIAASYGVTTQALGKYLLKHCLTEWQEAQVARALARKESAEEDLNNEELLVDAVSLARMRERLKAAQWDLERVCKRIYGTQAIEITGKDGKDLYPEEDRSTLARRIAFFMAQQREKEIEGDVVAPEPHDAAQQMTDLDADA